MLLYLVASDIVITKYIEKRQVFVFLLDKFNK